MKYPISHSQENTVHLHDDYDDDDDDDDDDTPITIWGVGNNAGGFLIFDKGLWSTTLVNGLLELILSPRYISGIIIIIVVVIIIIIIIIIIIDHRCGVVVNINWKIAVEECRLKLVLIGPSFTSREVVSNV
ncbi:hypothetical protein ANN_15684 [Periplaneta americana]|uniref:Uncharacterized protein n=1 Tax=Periplaneta americana TaxID=6978 RepID=A0ABQ8SIY9_PERAM|nr:hypothetical protein ANN_15684 [Periplaneta americana]